MQHSSIQTLYTIYWSTETRHSVPKLSEILSSEHLLDKKISQIDLHLQDSYEWLTHRHMHILIKYFCHLARLNRNASYFFKYFSLKWFKWRRVKLGCWDLLVLEQSCYILPLWVHLCFCSLAGSGSDVRRHDHLHDSELWAHHPQTRPLHQTPPPSPPLHQHHAPQLQRSPYTVQTTAGTQRFETKPEWTSWKHISNISQFL